jgi:tetratricopeptide (TPR) repeat protein
MLRILFLIPFFASLQLFSQVPLTGRDSAIKGPQSFAIVMGISHYRYIRPLAYADKDAELFRDWLKSPAGGKLAEANIFTLLNEEASNANFWGKGFQWLKSKQLQRGDKLFIYLAGHGDAIDEDQYFFLGVDCKPDGDKNNYLISGAIQLFNLKKKIALETAKGVDVVFIMDACRSNELPGGTPGQNFLNTAISQKKAGEIMMLATAAGQVSLEDASIGNGHGLFTWYLVDGLTGMADAGRPDRKITFGEIQSYVDNNVTSLAFQKFKRKQEPYFCCNENSDKVISLVDTAYLQQWLRIKKQIERRSGGNTIEESLTDPFFTADTLLIETYNRFNQAIRLNRLTGKNSAEDYFEQLNNKFPGNPYTLDAKSSLAVQFVNAAQSRVNRYLDCTEDLSPAEKQLNVEAALNLEKAIAIFRDIDADFASSLMNRVCLLKSCGDYGPSGKNGTINDGLREAYRCKLLEPNGAYIYNRIAQLHLQANNRDSAIYNANRAVELAPNWPCAASTLARARNINHQVVNPDSVKIKPVKAGATSAGVLIAAGINRPTDAFIANPNSPVISATPSTKPRIDIGGFLLHDFGKYFSTRPSITLVFQSTGFKFQTRNPAGGQISTDSVTSHEVFIQLAVPLIYRIPAKTFHLYLMAAPAAGYAVSQKQIPAGSLDYKKLSASVELGTGIDISLKRTPLILSPEFKYSIGLNDRKIPNSSIYSQALSDLRRNSFMLSLYFRKK